MRSRGFKTPLGILGTGRVVAAAPRQHLGEILIPCDGNGPEFLAFEFFIFQRFSFFIYIGLYATDITHHFLFSLLVICHQNLYLSGYGDPDLRKLILDKTVVLNPDTLNIQNIFTTSYMIGIDCQYIGNLSLILMCIQFPCKIVQISH